MERFIQIFLIIFLTSRFFSETLKVIPKAVDIIDLPFIVIVTLVGIFSLQKSQFFAYEYKTIYRRVTAIVFIALASSILNAYDLFIPAAILFLIGFLAGPVLCLSLNRIIRDHEKFAEKLKKTFFLLLYINIGIVLFVNIPQFLATGNPDFISGTFGYNAYFFSVFLVICGGMLLGHSEANNISVIKILLIQTLVGIIFYLLQFRAAVPFFFIAYSTVLIQLYGRRLIRSIVVAGVILLFVMPIVSNITARADTNLRFEDWLEILANPFAFVEYGKFVAYQQVFYLFSDQPLAALVGVGPGNFLSRAYITFGPEMMVLQDNVRAGRGVSAMIAYIFEMDGPRLTEVSNVYLAPTKTGAVLGSYQLSNPNSSYLAPIAELGIIGGSIVISLYIYLIKRSLQLLKLARMYVPEYLALAVGLTAGSIYILCLGVLDNYWEMSRATIPIWLLFWTTTVGVKAKLKKIQEMSEMESEWVPETVSEGR